ncbi:molybdenum-dependent transcriptional regulator [Thioalkalivibrio denitrificans]|uniref:Molybdenum-dependent transcriptional regulator n=1 Tax=Thioalkalivibrio denitrificans TaxID=108003 RepID=A0A1V3NKD2_9GAMM|nr:TOBE domain-containing protein [Thioalkalivibrio denitrificans]OOG25216.1 molybdenum-dependent transcriptional regulator [Thioalkalivibrio denitrificans]
MKAHVDGRFWLNVSDRGFLGAGRIELLERIGETGSISAAARSMGMSYKAAWDAVEAMNNLAEQPLVIRQAGGKRGGGTRLTRFGHRVIHHYRAADEAYRRFMEQLEERLSDLGDVVGFMRKMSMRTTAANHFQGRIREIRTGAVNDQVSVDIGGGQDVVAIVTRAAVGDLGLVEGGEVQVLFDASSVILAEDNPALRCSARNRLCGTVIETRDGAVNGEVKLRLAEGRVLTAIVTSESLAAPWLAVGSRVCALIKAPHVMLAVNT